MRIRLGAFELTDRDREALAYRIDGKAPNYDAPTGRKASRQEIIERFEAWISNELSESNNMLDDAEASFTED